MLLIVPFQYQRNSKSLIIEYMLKLYILHQNNLLFSMETNAVKENYKEVVSHFKSKLKLPIVLTYSIILILYNWDIIYYLIFQKGDVLENILYIKNINNIWHHRILNPIFIAIFYALLFPILQVGINYVFSWFKNKNNELERNEELDNAKHRFQVQKEISGSQELEVLNNQINSLMVEKNNLNNQISNINEQNEQLSKENIEIKQNKNEEIIILKEQNNKIIKENTAKILALSNEISDLKQLNEKLKEGNLNIQIVDNKAEIELIPRDKIIKNKVEEIFKEYNLSLSDEQKVVFIDIIKHLAVHQKDFVFSLNKITLFTKEINFVLDYLEEKGIIKNDKIVGIVSITNLGKEIIKYLLKNKFK